MVKYEKSGCFWYSKLEKTNILVQWIISVGRATQHDPETETNVVCS